MARCATPLLLLLLVLMAASSLTTPSSAARVSGATLQLEQQRQRAGDAACTYPTKQVRPSLS